MKILKTANLVDCPSRVEIKFKLFLRHLKVGLFLHIMTLISLTIFGLSFSYLDVSNGIFDITHFLYLFLSLFGITVAIISQFDAFGRFQNYKQLKDKFYKYGWYIYTHTVL